MKDQTEEDKGDPDEEILMAVVPKANLNGLKYSGGVRSRTFSFSVFQILSRRDNLIAEIFVDTGITVKEGMKLEVRRVRFSFKSSEIVASRKSIKR